MTRAAQMAGCCRVSAPSRFPGVSTSPSKSTYNGLEHDIYDTTSPHTWYSLFAPAGSSSLELENAPSTAVNFDEAPISLQDEDDDCRWLDDPDEESDDSEIEAGTLIESDNDEDEHDEESGSVPLHIARTEADSAPGVCSTDCSASTDASPSGCGGNSCDTGEADEGAASGWRPKYSGCYIFAPEPDVVKKAYDDLRAILKPRRKKGYGHVDPGLNWILREHFEAMALFCHNFLKLQAKTPRVSQWTNASLHTAKGLGHGPYQAKLLRNWTREFIVNPEFIPEHNWKGALGRSHVNDEDFAQDIHLHLQGIGNWVRAIVDYTATPEVLNRLGRRKPISLATAQRWMSKMGYQ
ncbi:hypothetical protein BC835DRAFT_1422518 [Cytidiella melzeri]|nr:hypothetical protein BC835DRAFT_1422518 [Cytidiella melzeri]